MKWGGGGEPWKAPVWLTVLDPPCQRLWAEASEHHGVHRSNTGARQHGRHCQRWHWHVNGHPVPLLNPMALQSVGEAAGGLQQLPVGQTAGWRWNITIQQDFSCLCWIMFYHNISCCLIRLTCCSPVVLFSSWSQIILDNLLKFHSLSELVSLSYIYVPWPKISLKNGREFNHVHTTVQSVQQQEPVTENTRHKGTKLHLNKNFLTRAFYWWTLEAIDHDVTE